MCSAAYSPVSQIRARIWSWKKDEMIDEEFFESKIISGHPTPAQHLGIFTKTDAIRLVHGESDGVPGLVADLLWKNRCHPGSVGRD